MPSTPGRALRIVLGLMLAVPCLALAQAKVPVHVRGSPSDNDSVGRQFVERVKAEIRNSQGLRLVEDQKDLPYLKVLIATIRSRSASDNATSVSVSILYDSKTMPMYGAFLASGVQTCGRDVVAECARDVLPDIDKALGLLRTHAPELHATLK